MDGHDRCGPTQSVLTVRWWCVLRTTLRDRTGVPRWIHRAARSRRAATYHRSRSAGTRAKQIHSPGRALDCLPDGRIGHDLQVWVRPFPNVQQGHGRLSSGWRQPAVVGAQQSRAVLRLFGSTTDGGAGRSRCDLPPWQTASVSRCQGQPPPPALSSCPSTYPWTGSGFSCSSAKGRRRGRRSSRWKTGSRS